MADYDAVVVGAGPNGLAAATTLAGEGASVLVVEANDRVGGGARTDELTLPGFRHDTCSAVHPLGVGSPYFRSLPLAEHGLEWLYPDVQAAHVLDGGQAAVLLRSVDETAEANGDPGWERLLRPVVEGWADLETDILRPALQMPTALSTFLKFGIRAPWPAAALAKVLLRSERSRALLAGIAAHSIARLDAPFTGAAGLVLAAAGHAVGWPVAKGGSQAISDALVGHLESLGGKVETGRRVADLDELPPSKVVLLDVTPWQAALLASSRLPHRYRERLRRVRHAWGSYKVDYALDGPVPWTAEAARRAGTVHVGGRFSDVAASEKAVSAGTVSERPFLLVGQQSLIDPTRAPAGKHTLWVYCHVPLRSSVDVTERIERQIERFAPGFRDLVLARSVKGPAELESFNANYVGGDITGGAADGTQLVLRPVASLHPYRTKAPGLYLCSSSTPPGPGVHGMCGHWAAKAALAEL